MSGVKLKVGCKDNNDCAGGLECQGEGVERKCQDFNECTDPRFKSDADAFCGANADCVNSVGSFYCTCHSGEQLGFLTLTERLFLKDMITGLRMSDVLRLMSARILNIFRP